MGRTTEPCLLVAPDAASDHASCWSASRRHEVRPARVRKALAGRIAALREEEAMEISTHTWTVELMLSDRDGVTHAEARLHTGLPSPLTATGDARLSPHDPVDVAEIGYELAAARALTHLGEALLRAADADVEGLLHDLHQD
jgi:Rv2632c-like